MMKQGFSTYVKRDRASQHLMSEINVTPMVDVMLVLLIVFMVAAPLLTVGVPVNLPQTNAKPLQTEEEPLMITVNHKGEVFVQETRIEVKNLVTHLENIGESGYNQRIYVRGDTNIAYGKVADVISRINTAGFTRVALITEGVTQGVKVQ